MSGCKYRRKMDNTLELPFIAKFKFFCYCFFQSLFIHWHGDQEVLQYEVLSTSFVVTHSFSAVALVARAQLFRTKYQGFCFFNKPSQKKKSCGNICKEILLCGSTSKFSSKYISIQLLLKDFIRQYYFPCIAIQV